MSDTIDSAIGKHVIHRAKTPKSYEPIGGWVYDVENRDVILLAVVGNYAMVKRPRCMPYVTTLDELILP